MANQTTTRKIMEGFNSELGRYPTKPQKKTGRPAKYTDPKELQKKVDEYFDECDKRLVETYDTSRHQVIKMVVPEPYTMSGLAYTLGMDRQGILTYTRKLNFYDIIKKARDKIATDHEKRLLEGKNIIGAIFALKNNFNWVDKTEVETEMSGKMGGFVLMKPDSKAPTTEQKEVKDLPEESPADSQKKYPESTPSSKFQYNS